MGDLVLYGTPLSHFTRKVRIVLHELAIPFDFQRVPNLLESTNGAAYGANPLMRIPTLSEDDRWIIESDHIVRYIVRSRAPSDPLRVFSEDIVDLNRLAALNGIMAHEVTILLAARGGMTDVTSQTYFAKLVRAIESALEWLDGQTNPDRAGFDYVDIATVCMWDHLVHFQLVNDLGRFTRLAARARRASERASVARTAPGR